MRRKPPTQPPKRLRGAARFRQSETARLVRGAMAAGLNVTGLEVDPGSGALRVLVGSGKSDEPNNDLDRWLGKKNARQA